MSLRCENLTKRYSQGNDEVVALGGVDIAIRPAEFVCLVGPSGCGKSTLLKIIGGLIPPTSGRVVFEQAHEGFKGSCRNAIVFQEKGIFPWMNVLDNATFGLEMQGLRRREREARALPLLEQFGLGEFVKRFPHELSVGMRQRVGIARAFLSDPDILLMDEPLAALDAQSKRLLQEELLIIWQQRKREVLYVTHDIEEAVFLGDRILIMSARPGRILREVPISLARPRSMTRDAQAIAELREEIWSELESDIIQSRR